MTIHRGRMRAPFATLCALLMSSTAVPALAQDTPATGEDQPEPEIILIGTRQATRDAYAEKRAADYAVQTLHGNDVGKLPDHHVAEAIKRLPGLSVAND